MYLSPAVSLADERCAGIPRRWQGYGCYGKIRNDLPHIIELLEMNFQGKIATGTGTCLLPFNHRVWIYALYGGNQLEILLSSLHHNCFKRVADEFPTLFSSFPLYFPETPPGSNCYS